MEHWSAHISCLEEASACVMNPGTVVDAGRQIKVVSLLWAEIHNKYVFNPPKNMSEDDDDNENEGYEGAVVIDTVKGFYGGPCDQVVLLDFASLYPSLVSKHFNTCIILKNISKFNFLLYFHSRFVHTMSALTAMSARIWMKKSKLHNLQVWL
jgi:hypothetical protein